LIIKRVFVPSNTLQGSTFSTYLLWDKKRKVKIVLKFSQKLDVVDLYNGEITETENENQIEISKFDTNGYVGIVFQTKIFQENKRIENITFEILENEKIIETIEKSIFLFRPEVKLINIAKCIKIESKNRIASNCSQGIDLINIGDGMGVVGLRPDKDSPIQLHEPENIFKFIKSVWKDLLKSLNELKNKFPLYDKAISEYILFGNHVVDHLDEMLSVETMEWHKKINEMFEKMLVSDTEFATHYIESVSIAYLKNFHLITNIENFVNYLKSIENNKILLINPILVLRATKKLKKFKGDVVIFDLNGHEYPPISISFDVDCDDDCEIPLHHIFSVTNGV
jgi:hypothetical protein